MITDRGLVNDVAAPKKMMMVAISKLSTTVELTRSKVTGPPKRMPAIQSGSGIVGSVNRFVPGTGTPIITPISTLNAITKSANLIAKLKLLDHGPATLYLLTSNETATLQISVTQLLSKRTKEVAISAADSHQVSG